MARFSDAMEQLGHPASSVSRFCRQVPSSLAGRDGSVNRTDPLSRLSDLAFGYRVTPRGLARRAPSAGAMYPVELAWITHDAGRWVFRHFDARLGACVEPSVDTDRPALDAAESLGLRPGQHALLLVAVAWRTIQRYGLRGYRYCNLDAGNVLANVASVAVASGATIRLPETVPHQQIHTGLGLTGDELLLGVAVVDGELTSALPDPGSAPQTLDRSRLFGTEQPPMLSPSMQRIRRLHQLSEPDRQHPLDFPALLGGPSPERAVRDILLRRSARAFAGADLPPEALGELHELAERLAGALPELEIRVLARNNGAWPSAAVLQSIFGDQPLAVRPPVHVIVGLRGRPAPPVYRHILLTAGLVCGALYQFAARRGLATTSFGGFDDARVAELAGGGFRPVVVQSFGHTAAGDEKNDTVAATWLNRRDA